MKTNDILKIQGFSAISPVITCEIHGAYCGELSGMALGRLKKNQIWITAAVNINTLAVAYQKNAACIIIAENSAVDDEFIQTAKKYEVTVFVTKLAVFEIAVLIGGLL